MGPWDIELTSDGKFLEAGASVGVWCSQGDLVIFGFNSSPYTAYRATLSANALTGHQSWDGGGTGTFEAVRK